MAIISSVTFLLGLCLSWADPRSEVDLEGGKPRGRPGPLGSGRYLVFIVGPQWGATRPCVLLRWRERRSPYRWGQVPMPALFCPVHRCIAPTFSAITAGLSQATQAWNLLSTGEGGPSRGRRQREGWRLLPCPPSLAGQRWAEAAST